MSCPFYKFDGGWLGGDYYCIKQEKAVDSDTYSKYCRNYDYKDCPIYKHQSSSGGCFLTSACTAARALPDDCYELQTLRNFRDNWLSKTEGGLAAISHYYITAPKIVDAINHSTNSKAIYDNIYTGVILPCVRFIENRQFEDAFALYKNAVQQYELEYGLSPS